MIMISDSPFSCCGPQQHLLKSIITTRTLAFFDGTVGSSRSARTTALQLGLRWGLKGSWPAGRGGAYKCTLDSDSDVGYRESKARPFFPPPRNLIKKFSIFLIPTCVSVGSFFMIQRGRLDVFEREGTSRKRNNGREKEGKRTKERGREGNQEEGDQDRDQDHESRREIR